MEDELINQEQEQEEKLFRCSICEKEFDEMPPDGFHSVHDRMITASGLYCDVDGECGPVYEIDEI